MPGTIEEEFYDKLLHPKGAKSFYFAHVELWGSDLKVCCISFWVT